VAAETGVGLGRVVGVGPEAPETGGVDDDVGRDPQGVGGGKVSATIAGVELGPGEASPR
jgi:hypothetical protein